MAISSKRSILFCKFCSNSNCLYNSKILSNSFFKDLLSNCILDNSSRVKSLLFISINCCSFCNNSLVFSSSTLLKRSSICFCFSFNSSLTALFSVFSKVFFSFCFLISLTASSNCFCLSSNCSICFLSSKVNCFLSSKF
uniref:hypothetical protein n=1 Tax=Pedobacter planticolens TaxID=2679964 RepID=UPI0015FFFE86